MQWGGGNVTEIPQDRDPPGHTVPLGRPLRTQSNSPCAQTGASENITFSKLIGTW